MNSIIKTSLIYIVRACQAAFYVVSIPGVLLAGVPIYVGMQCGKLAQWLGVKPQTVQSTVSKRVQEEYSVWGEDFARDLLNGSKVKSVRCPECRGKAHPGNRWGLTCSICNNRGVILRKRLPKPARCE